MGYRKTREEAERVLPPSSGPTQAATMPKAMFRAVIGLHGESVMEVTLQPCEAREEAA